jgi:hypothetical protein
VVLVLLDKLLAAHCSEVTVTGATSETLKDCEDPFSEAVMVAV